MAIAEHTQIGNASRGSHRSFVSKLRRLSPRQWSGVGLLLLLLGLAAWFGIYHNQQTTAETGKLQVAASFYPIYDLARHVGGNAASVSNVTPAGAEAHDFEPSPRTLTEAYQSDLFIYHDGTMEPWVSRFIQDYNGVSVRAIEGIDLHSSDEHSNTDEPESASIDHAHPHDPHVWVDPVLASQMVDTILAGFVKADPLNRTTYEANAAQLKADLAKLDQEFRRQLLTCTQRTIVTSHAAYHYLADRYNLTILPISGLTPAQEPSAGKLAELSKLVTKLGIHTIFFESQANPHLAETLARETGVTTAILDPIEGINQASKEESYVGIQEKNLANLTAALACN